jgi:hypothetical protein
MPKPPAGQDFYLVIPLQGSGAPVQTTPQIYLAAGATEEEAIAKVKPLLIPPMGSFGFVAIVATVFDP